MKMNVRRVLMLVFTRASVCVHGVSVDSGSDSLLESLRLLIRLATTAIIVRAIKRRFISKSMGGMRRVQGQWPLCRLSCISNESASK